jgi:hypothetical protein
MSSFPYFAAVPVTFNSIVLDVIAPELPEGDGLPVG